MSVQRVPGDYQQATLSLRRLGESQDNQFRAVANQYQALAEQPRLNLRAVVQKSSAAALALEGLFAIFGTEKQRQCALALFAPTAQVFAATLPTPPRQVTVVGVVTQSKVCAVAKLAEPQTRRTVGLQNTVLQLEQRVQRLERTQGEIARQLAVTQGELTIVRVQVLGD